MSTKFTSSSIFDKKSDFISVVRIAQLATCCSSKCVDFFFFIIIFWWNIHNYFLLWRCNSFPSMYSQNCHLCLGKGCVYMNASVSGARTNLSLMEDNVSRNIFSTSGNHDGIECGVSIRFLKFWSLKCNSIQISNKIS